MIKIILVLLQSRKGVLIRNSVSQSLKRNDVLKEFKNLQISKATQESDIPIKLIKNNSDLFVDFIFTKLNNSRKCLNILCHSFQN